MELLRLSASECSIDPSKKLKVTTMGNIIETQYMEHRNTKQVIEKIDSDHYALCSTGEVYEFRHGETRKDNKKGLLKTFARMRALINTNVTDVSKVRWCTLTYADNMKDPKQLYNDFRAFNQRFQRWCKGQGYSKPEYIVMMEPQGRGAWHAHLLYIWQDQVAPYIKNSTFASLWGHGFVKVKKLDNVDNVGAYLTAYLGDMELSDCEVSNQGIIKQVQVEEDGTTVSKKIVKGARLDLYPVGFNMFRHSSGLEEPKVEFLDSVKTYKKVSAATKTFESAVLIRDDSYENLIIKTYYNTIRAKRQAEE